MQRALRAGVTIVLLLALGGIGALLADQGTVTYKKYFEKPCTEPLPYRVGSIDARFHTTSTEIQTALEESAQVWNDAAGHPVLAYAPNDAKAIPVNFVYDERQQALSVEQQLADEKSALAAKRESLDQLQAEYKSAQDSYLLAKKSFEARYQAYQSEVEAANAKGGASGAEYTRLQQLGDTLQADQEALNSQADALNALASTVKARVDMFNQGVVAVNKVVNSFNAVHDTDFDAGKYVRTATSTRITIYYFDSRNKLLLEVAHEFGHALGLDHNDNPDSVMYPYGKGQKLVLSPEDLAALKEACKLK